MWEALKYGAQVEFLDQKKEVEKIGDLVPLKGFRRLQTEIGGKRIKGYVTFYIFYIIVY